MRLAIATVLVLAACGEVRQVPRWPNHRREKDAQIEHLEQQAAVLISRASALEQRVHALEVELAKLQQQAQPQAAPPPGS